MPERMSDEPVPQMNPTIAVIATLPTGFGPVTAWLAALLVRRGGLIRAGGG